jgi:DNA-directed RNA polymerase subunit RPC12/RpoP
VSSCGQTKGSGRGIVGDTLIRCPHCNTDHLVPLHFPICRLEEAAEEIIRPVAKCSECGHRVFARVVTRRAKTSDTTV